MRYGNRQTRIEPLSVVSGRSRRFTLCIRGVKRVSSTVAPRESIHHVAVYTDRSMARDGWPVCKCPTATQLKTASRATPGSPLVQSETDARSTRSKRPASVSRTGDVCADTHPSVRVNSPHHWDTPDTTRTSRPEHLDYTNDEATPTPLVQSETRVCRVPNPIGTGECWNEPTRRRGRGCSSQSKNRS